MRFATHATFLLLSFFANQAEGQNCLNEKPKDNAFSVKIGFWRNTGGGKLGDPCYSCVGEPMIETFYPIADAEDKCWQWPGSSGKNSMKSGTCTADQSFTFNQWAGTCTCSGRVGARVGATKQIFKHKCVVDRPSAICAQVVDYSACEEKNQPVPTSAATINTTTAKPVTTPTSKAEAIAKSKAFPPHPEVARRTPNFIFYMTDDMHYQWEDGPANAPGTPINPSNVQTPNLDTLRSESLVFSRAYSTTATCAPSRYSLLTGRFCSRSNVAAGRSSTSYYDVEVTNPGCKLAGADYQNNLAAMLKGQGYNTFFTGKWHISDGKAQWDNYTAVVEGVKAAGFTHADGVYIDNIKNTHSFSHNLEWMTASALSFIDESVKNNVPFHAHITPTVPHSPSVYDTLTQHSNLEVPWGTLPSIPKSDMPSRQNVLSRAIQAAGSTRKTVVDKHAGPMWVDDSIGALIRKLEAHNILDDTVFVFMFDHGQAAKNVLVEAGVRIAQFVRYPHRFNKGSSFSGPVSNVDWLPTVMDLMQVSSSSLKDGASWLPLVPTSNLEHQGTETPPVYQSKRSVVVELNRDRAVISERFKLISKNSNTAAARGGAARTIASYPNYNDTEQLYDLLLDPSERTNLIDNINYADVATALRQQLDCHRRVTSMGDASVSPSSECLYGGDTTTIPPTAWNAGDLQWGAFSSSTTTASLAAALSSEVLSTARLQGTGYCSSGWLAGATLASGKLCSSFCSATPGCRSWSYCPPESVKCRGLHSQYCAVYSSSSCTLTTSQGTAAGYFTFTPTITSASAVTSSTSSTSTTTNIASIVNTASSSSSLGTAAAKGIFMGHGYCSANFVRGLYSDSLAACATTCRNRPRCNFFSFCPAATASCNGLNANYCAIYSGSVCSTTNQLAVGYLSYQKPR